MYITIGESYRMKSNTLGIAVILGRIRDTIVYHFPNSNYPDRDYVASTELFIYKFEDIPEKTVDITLTKSELDTICSYVECSKTYDKLIKILREM